MHRIALLLLVIASLNVPLYSQADFTGVWVSTGTRQRIQDPHPGEYAGVPLNEAGKQRANTWSASIQKLQVWQCRPAPHLLLAARSSDAHDPAGSQSDDSRSRRLLRPDW